MDDNFVIEFKGKKFIPSVYQQDIFKNVKYGVGNTIIKACAGSGKTSVIVNLINLIEKNNKLLFIAFNKDIVNELKKRIGNLKNVDIMTYHSLGYSILKDNINMSLKNVDEFKYRTYVKNNIRNLSNINIDLIDKISYNTYINNICHLIDYSRYNLCQSYNEIYEISKKYGIVNLFDECNVVEQVLKWGQTNLLSIDYTDMVWLPIELNLSSKKYEYNWVLIDEVQDASLIQQQLFLKTFKRGGRFVAVGDDFQKINLWAGASETAMSDLYNIPNTKLFSLPITYRCPKLIVKMAQKYSNNIEANDNAIDGEINYDVSVNAPKSGDMVLCRTTAPLIELYMKYLRCNKKSYIRGKDIGKNLISLINEFNDEEFLFKNNKTEGLLEKLDNKLKLLKNIITNNNGIDENDADSCNQIIDLMDSINAIKVLSEGLTTTNELINKINDIFLDADGDGVCLSTIHKAKGLECDNVFILCKSLMPSKFAKKDWEKITELNLIYVAITRAKKTLNFISEKEFPPSINYYVKNSNNTKSSNNLNKNIQTKNIQANENSNTKLINKTKNKATLKFKKFL